jgi:hypothetical protein
MLEGIRKWLGIERPESEALLHHRLDRIEKVLYNTLGYRVLPKGAESLDVRRYCEFEKGDSSEQTLISLTAKNSEYFHITGYSIVSDAELSADVEFFFRLNKRRVLRWHGDPSDQRYRITLGLSPDLSTLIPSEIVIAPTETLVVSGVNRSNTLDQPLGVRLSGFVDRVNRFDSEGFGT